MAWAACFESATRSIKSNPLQDDSMDFFFCWFDLIGTKPRRSDINFLFSLYLSLPLPPTPPHYPPTQPRPILCGWWSELSLFFWPQRQWKNVLRRYNFAFVSDFGFCFGWRFPPPPFLPPPRNDPMDSIGRDGRKWPPEGGEEAARLSGNTGNTHFGSMVSEIEAISIDFNWSGEPKTYKYRSI